MSWRKKNTVKLAAKFIYLDFYVGQIENTNGGRCCGEGKATFLNIEKIRKDWESSTIYSH